MSGAIRCLCQNFPCGEHRLVFTTNGTKYGQNWTQPSNKTRLLLGFFLSKHSPQVQEPIQSGVHSQAPAVLASVNHNCAAVFLPGWACTTSCSGAASCCGLSWAWARRARTPARASSPRRSWASPAWRPPRWSPSLPSAPEHSTVSDQPVKGILLPWEFFEDIFITSILLMPPIPLPP